MTGPYNKGFTIVEILVVLVIMIIIGGIVLTSFSGLNNAEALNTDTDTVLSMIERARTRSVSSENSIEYGIHFASTTVVLYVGKTYTAGSSTSETKNISSKVKVKSINLTGGAYDLYFNRLSGKPSATGTVVFSMFNNASTTKTITIYNTGISDSH